MADSKKYEGSQWEHSLRKLTTATEAVENPLYSDGTAITAYTINGNTVQDGTPTPSNPVDVNGVGERTENLYSGSIKAGGWSGLTGSVPTSNSSADRIGTNAIFAIDNTKTYTVAVFPSTLKVAVMLLGSDNKILSDTGWSASNYQTITDAYGFVASIKKSSGAVISPSECEGIVLIEGSTAPTAYEPYGYKIPISSGGVTTNIYLGSTQTTRQINKLVLDGKENWVHAGVDAGQTPNFRIEYFTSAQPSKVVCTHYTSPNESISIFNQVEGVKVQTSSQVGMVLIIRPPEYAVWSVDDFKSFLAAQYAAGTPVTVWYVLATETTAAVNEPLMKIGDFADTLSNAASIPTTEGANSTTVDTTVQPSEFTATWTGWHNATTKEWDGSDWQ